MSHHFIASQKKKRKKKEVFVKVMKQAKVFLKMLECVVSLDKV